MQEKTILNSNSSLEVPVINSHKLISRAVTKVRNIRYMINDNYNSWFNLLI